MRVNDLAARFDEEAVWQGALPTSVDDFHQFVFVFTGVNIVWRRRLLLFQELQGLGLNAAFVGADADELESTVAVHPVEGHQFGEFLDAGDTPGGPKVDETKLFSIIAYQCRDAVEADGI